MTHGTIEETYEYRLTTVIKKVMKDQDFEPKDGNDLFDWLEEPKIAETFIKTLIEDAIQWGGDEEFWFKKVTAI